MTGDARTDAPPDDAPRRDFPRWMAPMLATLTRERFSDPDWIFERKLDGERCLAFRSGDAVRLLSRNRKDLGDTYPEVVRALASQGGPDIVADGEIVAFRDAVTSFSRLQERMQITDPDEARDSGVAVYYYLFDLMHLDGRDLRGLPLRRRKALLRRALDFDDPLRLTAHRNGRGEAFFASACRRGWEGCIAKDARAPYAAGRSRHWLKFKCVHRQELVVGGYTEPRGSRQGFGALLVGHYQGDDLVYAGKVGTGYDEDTLRRLADRFGSLERKTPPFARGDPPGDAHWLSPELVAEVGFTEWTAGGKLRHPRFLGLRRDKDPRDVVREDTHG